MHQPRISDRLSGGHHNSLGNTDEVAAFVINDHSKLDELFDCYKSDDEVVRLRTSSALKRVFQSKPDWFTGAFERVLKDMGGLNQDSARWTFAQICQAHDDKLSNDTRDKAKAIVYNNLTHSNDWIVLIQSMSAMTHWAKNDKTIRPPLLEILHQRVHDKRKSVAKNAQKFIAAIENYHA